MAYTTGSEVSIREDLSDYISNLDPADIPLQATLGRIPVTQKMYEYTVDSFNQTRTVASIATGARGENAAFFSNIDGTLNTSFTAAAYPARLHSVQQINSDGVTVSGTDRVSVMAGISDPFEYRIYQAMVRVANAQELALLWGTGSASTAATRLTQGLVHWIAFTGLARSLGVSTVGTNGLFDVDASATGNCIPGTYWSNFYNAGGVNMDLSMMTDKILGNAVDVGFRVPGSYGFCGRKVKAQVSSFALTVNGPLNYRQIAASENTVSENVTYIETASHGTTGIFYNRYFDFPGQSLAINNTNASATGATNGVTSVPSGLYNSSFPCNKTIVFIMPEYFKIATLRGLGWGPLPRMTDGDSGAVIGEQGLVCLNPVAGTGACNVLAG